MEASKNKKRERRTPGSYTPIDAEKFWNDLQAMPYDNSKVGQSFVILPGSHFLETENMENKTPNP
jgi:hypothetical protein